MDNYNVKIDQLLNELKEYEDKISYHGGQQAVYMSKCIDVLEELKEVGYDVL